jgi:hypothetical protein
MKIIETKSNIEKLNKASIYRVDFFNQWTDKTIGLLKDFKLDRKFTKLKE